MPQAACSNGAREVVAFLSNMQVLDFLSYLFVKRHFCKRKSLTSEYDLRTYKFINEKLLFEDLRYKITKRMLS